MQIRITKNKIEDKLNEYQKKTGASKTWISEQLGISKQRLYAIVNSNNMMLDVALKFALFLNCDIKDLIEYEVENNE